MVPRLFLASQIGRGWVLCPAKACYEAAGSGLFARPLYIDYMISEILGMQASWWEVQYSCYVGRGRYLHLQIPAQPYLRAST